MVGSDELKDNNMVQEAIESALDEADKQAASTTVRYTHEEVFGSISDELLKADYAFPI